MWSSARPEGVDAVFQDRASQAEAFARLLVTTGVEHGLIGPREIDRIWERHILNCAVVETLIPQGCRVVDVGSGAGLPGIALAIARPDLDVTLVEPLLRRTQWLEGAVSELSLERTRVVRGRAEELIGRISGDVVVARAVAELGRLTRWCLPLVSSGGLFLALKGQSAQAELAQARPLLRSLAVTSAEVVLCGTEVVEEPTRVIRIAAAPSVSRGTRRRSRKSRP